MADKSLVNHIVEGASWGIIAGALVGLLWPISLLLAIGWHLWRFGHDPDFRRKLARAAAWLRGRRGGPA